MPEGMSINEIEIHYKKQTVLGEKLCLIFDGKTCVMKDGNGETHTIIKI